MTSASRAFASIPSGTASDPQIIQGPAGHSTPYHDPTRLLRVRVVLYAVGTILQWVDLVYLEQNPLVAEVIASGFTVLDRPGVTFRPLTPGPATDKEVPAVFRAYELRVVHA